MMQSKHHPIQSHHANDTAMQIRQQEIEQQQPTMTILESLEPVQPQPVLSMLDPVQHQDLTVIHKQQQEPQLHQLQAPAKNNLHQQQQHQLEQQEHPHQHHAQQHQHEDNISRGQQQQSVCQRPHIEGIVADGGGPIIQWLLDNYEIAEGESLPRSTVYNHYLVHCRQLQMSSVNAASFGKLIRSVFIGLKTRRLGTRGHSKYHYFGVRAKQHVCLDWLHDEQQLLGGCSSSSLNNNENSNADNTDSADDCLSSSSSNHKRVRKSSHHSKHYNNLIESQLQDDDSHHHQHQLRSQHAEQTRNHSNEFYHTEVAVIQPTIEQHQQHQHQIDEQYQHTKLAASNGISNGHGTNEHNDLTSNNNYIWPGTNYCNLADYRNNLGINYSTLIDDHWPARNDALFHQGRQQHQSNAGGELADCAIDYHQTTNLLNAFETNYKSYYKRMIELLNELKFAEVEQLWFDFWHPAPTSNSAATAAMMTFQGATTVHWTGDENDLSLVTSSAVETATRTPNATANSNGTSAATAVAAENQQQDQQQQQQSENHYHHQQHPRAPLLGTVAHLSNNLTFNHLYQLTSQPNVIERINQIDYSLFQAIEKFLIPELLAPIPRPLVQQMRMFAKNFSNWIELAIKDLPHQFVSEKTKSAQAFGHALLRYTSINHLAVASRAIWDKRTILAQMSSDLNRIDLRDIEHQVSLMSQEKEDDNCSLAARPVTSLDRERENGTNNGGNQFLNVASQRQDNDENSSADDSNRTIPNVQPQQQQLNHHHQIDRSALAMQPAQLIQDFSRLLENPYAGNYWSDWCRNLVEFCGHSFSDAKNFILKWNFYISLILKELTLKSAPSLGPFQLIKLLFDEYIYYLVVVKLARAQNKTFAQLLKPATTPTTTTATTTTTSSLAAQVQHDTL